MRTGDVATTDGEGRLMLTGRIGNQVIIFASTCPESHVCPHRLTFFLKTRARVRAC